MAKDIILDFTKDFESDGARKGRRKKTTPWTEIEKAQTRNYLQRIGFTTHEINLWIAEEIPIRSRPGQNLVFARRKLMKYWEKKGKSFPEARTLASEDRVESTKETHPGISKKEAEDFIWGTLYTLSPKERKITGPIIRLR